MAQEDGPVVKMLAWDSRPAFNSLLSYTSYVILSKSLTSSVPEMYYSANSPALPYRNVVRMNKD